MNTLYVLYTYLNKHISFNNILLKEYLTRDFRSIHVAMNDGIRKIFGWNRWESIRELRHSFGYDDIYVMAAKRKRVFLSSLHCLNNPLLLFLKQQCAS